MKYDVKMLKDMEIMRLYKENIRKRITENNEQQNNRNEETSETKWRILRKWWQQLLMRWMDMKKGGRGTTGMIRNARKRPNKEITPKSKCWTGQKEWILTIKQICEGKPSKCESKKKNYLGCWEVLRKQTKNEPRKLYTIAHGMKPVSKH